MQKDESVDDDISTIRKLILDSNAKFAEGDIEGYLSIRSSNALEIPPNQEIKPFDGTKAFYVSFNEKFAMRPIKPAKFDEIMVSGTLAVVLMTVDYDIVPKSGDEPIRSQSRHMMVLKKNSNSEWKVVRDMWHAGVIK